MSYCPGHNQVLALSFGLYGTFLLIIIDIFLDVC